MANPLISKLSHGADLPDEDLEFLERITSRPRLVPAQTDLVRQRVRHLTVHVLLDGFACSFKVLPNGARQIISLFVPGDVCDLQTCAIIEPDHAIATLSRSAVVEIAPALARKFAQRPRLNRALQWSALVEQSILGERLLGLGRRNAAEQVAHFYCEAHARLQTVGLTNGNEFELPITQADLADILGITSVHANRTLRRLRRDGLLLVDRKQVRIPDVERLRDLAGFDPHYLHLRQPRPPGTLFPGATRGEVGTAVDRHSSRAA